jgi:hypothetical protein
VRSVAASVLLAMVIGLAALSAAMFGFVLLAAPGECTQPSCAAVQTYDPEASVPAVPGATAEPPPVPEETEGPQPEGSPALTPSGSPGGSTGGALGGSPTGSPGASPAP